MARRKRTNHSADNPFDDSRDNDSRSRSNRRSSSTSRTRTKRRRWPWVLLFLLLLIGLLPNIIGWTGMHQTAINYFASDFNGKINIEKASLGWFQPVSLSNISAVDNEGNDLLKVESVQTSNRLYSFLTGSNYGELNIVKPVAYVQLRPDGSNLEDAVAKYMQPSANGNNPAAEPKQPATESPLPKITVNVTEGRALITTVTDSQSWQINDLNAILNTSTATAPLEVDAKCQIVPMNVGADGQAQLFAPGALSLQAQLDTGSKVLKIAAVDVALATENLPVSIAAPIMQRFVGPAQSAGQLSGNFHSQIDLNKTAMLVEIANLNLQGLSFVAPELIGSDRINIQQLVANGSLNISPQAIKSSNFVVQSDFGKITANGNFDVNQLNALAAGGTLLDDPFSLDGKIDLVGLVRMLPATLKLHEDLTVDSGTITFTAGTKNEEGTRRLVINMDAANLKARRGNQNIVWQKPLRLVGTLAQANGRLAIEDLLCESDFLSIAGSATPEQGAFRAQGDLAKLMQRVSEFADLTGVNLAGQLDGNFGWQTADGAAAIAGEQPIQIGGTFVIDQPVIQLPDMPVWQPPQLSVKMSAAGQSITNSQTNEMILKLDQGGIQVDVGPERAIATLAAPLQNVFTDPVSLNCEVGGSLAGWLGHVRNFVDVGDLQAAGDLKLNCLAALNNNTLQLSNVQYAVDQLAFDGYGMKIRDPQVTGTAEMAYELNSGNMNIADATIVGNTLAARGQNLKMAFAPNMMVDGVIAFRADVNRVADWFELSPTQDSVFWFGSAEGNLQLASTAQGIGGRLTSTITDLVAAQQKGNPQSVGQSAGSNVQQVSNKIEWSELFREAKTELNTEVLLASDFNAVQFKNFVMKSSALSVEAAGSVSDLASTLLTNVSGTWNPDWQKVQTLIAAYTGDLFKLTGSGKQPFSVRGPVFAAATGPDAQSAWIPPQLEANTGVRWDQGSIIGVPIGASQIVVDVKNSFGKISTPGIPFAGGVVQFAPGVDMRGENPLLVMEQTRVIDNVALTADTARQWLKYVAPLVADATSAQGNFTLDVQAVQMPIFDPMSVEADATVRLNNVMVGAGPLADQLLGSINQIRAILKPEADAKQFRTTLQMEEQTIPVKIKNQTVYHENVTFKHNDLRVVTSGAVGFNQSLNMLAEIPIADDWIAGKSYLAGLKGQKISIPISGTVTKPVFDRRSIQNLSTQLVKQAAGNAVNQVIADKVAPKLGEFQNQLNDKVGGEIGKLQSKLGEKVGQQIGSQLGNQFGEQLKGQLPNLGGFLPNNGGQFLPNNNGAAQAGSGTATPPAGGGTSPANGVGNGTAPAPAQPSVQQQLEGELIKGIGNLFGGKKK